MTYVGLDSCEGCHRQKALEKDQDNLCLDCRKADPFTCHLCKFTTTDMNDLYRVMVYAYPLDESTMDVCIECL